MARRWRDDANWTGIEMKSLRNQHTPERYRFDGYPHVTIGEWMVAKLLTRMGIPYTPDVTVTMTAENGKDGAIWVPDFVFNKKAYVWNTRERQFLIHGIEVKRARMGYFRQRDMDRVRMLKEQRGISILLLSHKQIRYFMAKGKLPLEPARMSKAERRRAAKAIADRKLAEKKAAKLARQQKKLRRRGKLPQQGPT